MTGSTCEPPSEMGHINMAHMNHGNADTANGALLTADSPGPLETEAAGRATDHTAPTPPPASGASTHPGRKKWMWAGGLIGLTIIGAYLLVPTVETSLNTVSTDDAFVNGHVTLVAPRVPGQVIRVLVDDNNRVKKGDLLVQLDQEPYQVLVDVKQAAVVSAEADVAAAQSQVRGILAQARSQRWKLQRAMDQVDQQVALLRSRVAALRSKEASLHRAEADFDRAIQLSNRGSMVGQEFDRYRESVQTAEAAVNQALEEVYEARVSLGLSPLPATSDLTDVPADVNQTSSSVRQALSELVLTMTQVGLPLNPMSQTPQQALDEFTQRDRDGNLDRILDELVPEAPAVLQAESKLLQARRDLAQAELNLSYCNVFSEIDGVVTSRNVNPGNNVAPGQGLMAVRSISEIWIDANFKETQLADLRIGQKVRCEVDMYGSRHEFEGRITGFTMGTGQTLALLSPQNATGNYVKIVQRLPVRIELTDYDPDTVPLFVGLSVMPYVYYKEPPTGPHAGEILQPVGPLPQGATESMSSFTPNAVRE